MKPKKKPSFAEQKEVRQDVEYRGKKYDLHAYDKVSEKDGIVESNLHYTPHFRPGGSKSRWNFGVGICLHKKPCKKCRVERA